MREVKRYRLYIVRLASMHSIGSGTNLLKRSWTLFHSGVAHGERHQAGMGLLISPPLGACTLGFFPVDVGGPGVPGGGTGKFSQRDSIFCWGTSMLMCVISECPLHVQT